MTVALEIINSFAVWGERKIGDLNEKSIVPNPIARRRLTRASKILLYLAHKTSFAGGKIVLGTEFGECTATAEIINAILQNATVSPTAFQNSVHNTPASYLSIQSGNTNEIVTVSDFGSSADSALKVGAIKALSGAEVLISCVDSLDFAHIDEMNGCNLDFLECGAAIVVKVSDIKPDIFLQNKRFDGFLQGHFMMLELCENFNQGKKVFEIQI